MGQDPYVYPGTNVLVNRFDVRDPSELAAIEARLVWPRFVQAFDAPIAGTFNLAHLQAIHGHLFGDVYAWAGEIRTVPITKAGEIEYARPQVLKAAAADIFGRLARDDYLSGLRRDDFVFALADLMGDIHVLHPFRDGNTRTLQTFTHHLALHAGHEIEWRKVDPVEIRRAGLHAATVDNSGYEQLLRAAMDPGREIRIETLGEQRGPGYRM